MMDGGDDRDLLCEKSLLEYVRKSTPPPFLLKTYMLVEDPATDEIISWNGEGTAFVVWQPAEFARDLLPTLFKHSNFSSFVRQLNTYGFRKIATSRWEFSNDMFGKGKKDLLCDIRRRKAWTTTSKPHNKSGAQPPPPPPQNHHHQAPNINNKDQTSDEGQSQSQRSSSTSSSSEYSILVDENKRLKKENGFLSSELFSMKRKCKDLLDLVAVYATNAAATTATNVPKEHDEGGGDDHGPKLFGVRLEVQGGEMGRKRKFAPENVFVFQSCK